MGTRHTAHTAWCAHDHRCSLAEHRAEPITIRTPGAGSAVLTRVRTSNGTQYAEVRLSITLPRDDAHARQRLAALLTHLRTLIGPAPRAAVGCARKDNRP